MSEFESAVNVKARPSVSGEDYDALLAERDRLREQCELNDMVHGTKGRERVAALLAKNEALSKDAARLDWLDGYIVIAEHEDTGKFAFNSIKGALRECVDAAMAAKEA